MLCHSVLFQEWNGESREGGREGGREGKREGGKEGGMDADVYD